MLKLLRGLESQWDQRDHRQQELRQTEHDLKVGISKDQDPALGINDCFLNSRFQGGEEEEKGERETSQEKHGGQQ